MEAAVLPSDHSQVSALDHANEYLVGFWICEPKGCRKDLTNKWESVGSGMDDGGVVILHHGTRAFLSEVSRFVVICRNLLDWRYES
jgi:hypothetical protein